MDDQTINTDPKTIESIILMFFIHLNKRSQTQHCDLINDFKAFLSFYPDLQEYKIGEKETINQRILRIKNYPVKFYLDHNAEFLTRNEYQYLDSDYSLAELDYIFYRDTSLINSLKKIYGATFRQKTRYNKRIMLSQVLKILHFIKSELYTYMVFFTSQKKVQINYVPEVKNYEENKTQEGFWNG